MSSMNGTQKRLEQQKGSHQQPWKLRVCPVFTAAKLSRPAPSEQRVMTPGAPPASGATHDQSCIVGCLGHECMFFRELRGPDGAVGFDCAISLVAMSVGEVGAILHQRLPEPSAPAPQTPVETQPTTNV